MRLSFVFLALMFFGCPPSSRYIFEGPLARPGKHLLHPRYTKGESFQVQHSISEVLEARDSPQGDWKMANSIVQDWTFTVAKSKKHVTKLKGHYDHLSVAFDMGAQGTRNYDSNDQPRDGMEKIFARMVGTEVELWGNVRDSLLEAKGAEELMGHMFKKDADYNGNDWLAESLNFNAIFPYHAVGDGDSWEMTHCMTSFYPMCLKATYTVSEITDGKMKIEMLGTVSPNPAGLPTSEMGMKINYAFSGPASGTYLLDLAQAKLIETSLALNLKGDCTVALPDGTEMGFPVTLTKTDRVTFTR